VTEINFYHMTRSSLEAALPKLLEKTLEAGKRAVVMAGSEERVESLNNTLWVYGQATWLPHGSAQDGHGSDQPVWLTPGEDVPNGATFLFLTDGAAVSSFEPFERCFELFDGNDPAAVERSRERWRSYKEAGHTLNYWQQNDRGGWERKD
jgi:DNA polymerase-3 subunit chi